MRYVILKKRNTSKASYLTKKILTVSSVFVAIISMVVLPTFIRLNKYEASKSNELTIVDNETFEIVDEIETKLA